MLFDYDSQTFTLFFIIIDSVTVLIESWPPPAASSNHLDLATTSSYSQNPQSTQLRSPIFSSALNWAFSLRLALHSLLLLTWLVYCTIA